MKLTKYFEQRKREKIRKERIRKAKVAATGVITGSVLGAVGGVLLAPKSGKETREIIAESSKNVTTQVNTKLVEGKDRLTEATGKIKDYIAEKKAARSAKEATVVVEEIAATEDN